MRNEIRYRCWSCVGNGIIAYPRCDPVNCGDCGGTGIDQKRTKDALVARWKSLRALGLGAWHAWWMAHKSN